MSCVEKETTTLFSVHSLCFPVLEVVLNRLLDKQGTNLFDIYDPQVLPQEVSFETVKFWKLNFVQTRTNKSVGHLLLFSCVLQGFTVIEMDFGFPHHLLVEFLRKTLQEPVSA